MAAVTDMGDSSHAAITSGSETPGDPTGVPTVSEWVLVCIIPGVFSCCANIEIIACLWWLLCVQDLVSTKKVNRLAEGDVESVTDQGKQSASPQAEEEGKNHTQSVVRPARFVPTEVRAFETCNKHTTANVLASLSWWCLSWCAWNRHGYNLSASNCRSIQSWGKIKWTFCILLDLIGWFVSKRLLKHLVPQVEALSAGNKVVDESQVKSTHSSSDLTYFYLHVF